MVRNQPQPLAWMAQFDVNIQGILHGLPHHHEKHLTKYDPDKVIFVEYHINNFYLLLRIMNV